MTTTCPKCQRKLLSLSSARCNWCGHEIADPDYQQQAAIGRAAFFLEQAQHDAQELALIEGINAFPYVQTSGPGLFGSMITGSLRSSRRAMAQADALAIQQKAAQQLAAQQELQSQQAPGQLPVLPSFSQPSTQPTEPEAEPQTIQNPKEGRFQHLEL